MIEPLGNYIKVEGGFAFKSSEFVKEGVPIIRISNFDDGVVNLTKCVKYPAKDFEKYQRYEVIEGDILMAMSGATTGKVGILKGLNDRCWLNQRVGNFKILNKDKLFKKFLYYIITSKDYQRKLLNIASGCAQPNISAKQLESIEVNIPNIETQKKIVSLLEKAEKSKDWRKEADDLTKDFLKSVFLEMFGNPATNPKKFPQKDLLSFSSEKPKYGSGASAINYDGKIRYIRITDIDEFGSLRDSSIASPSEFDKEYLLEKGDLIFARTGATVGKTYLHQENNRDSIYAGYMIRFRFNKNECNPVYVYHLTKSKYYWSWVNHIQTQATQPNINAKQYGSLEIPLPPIELQNKFASIVKEVEALKEQQKHSKNQIDNLFNALMQKAFKGELKC